MWRNCVVLFALVGCGGNDKGSPDAPAAIDAAVDGPGGSLALDCTTYCAHLQADCTGSNAQISMENCIGTCMVFPPGAVTDTTGNTLGCRNYHLQNIEVRSQPAATHCPHAGPVGGQIAVATAVCGTSPCDDFCELQTKVCGTDAAPRSVRGTAIANRYPSLAACKTACAGFTKTPEASPSVTSGNNFACRIYHMTNAAAQATALVINSHCGHTLDSTNFPMATVGPCFQ